MFLVGFFLTMSNNNTKYILIYYIYIAETILDDGPIEEDKTIDQIRNEPFTLPEDFQWDTLSLDDPFVLKELYTLLNENYVEDEDSMFRFDYQPHFLKWYF